MKKKIYFDRIFEIISDIGLFTFEVIGTLLLLFPWLNALVYYWDPSTCNQVPLNKLVVCGFVGFIVLLACHIGRLEQKLLNKDKSKD